MKTNLTRCTSGAHARLFKSTFTAGLLPALLLLLAIQPSHAGSATWKASPATGVWNHAANWSPATIPNGSTDTATFATSNKAAVSLSDDILVDGIVFSAGANAFTIDAGAGHLLQIAGFGITNNSGITQNFVVPLFGQMLFSNSATAGSQTNFTVTGDVNGGGSLTFFQNSSAGNATFTVNDNGGVLFRNTATASSGIFTIDGAANSSGSGGSVGFGSLVGDSPTAGTATLIANGGTNGGSGATITFNASSVAGTARVEVFGNGAGDFTNGTLYIGGHSTPGVTIGSIEGSGLVSLGDRNLTVGSNNRSTTFSGRVQGGSTGGSLTKIGKGKLSLTKGNVYTGGTTVSKGTLLVKNKSGSATGTGAVQVNAGTLGGTGIIAGAVTVGTGSGTGAFVSPGNSATKPGTLTINSTLTFNSDSTYKCALDRTIPVATQVAANGVTINSAAQFAFADLNTGTLTAGTVFMVISNTAATPIAGTFSNLADGSTFTSTGGTNLQASYTGGTGNDLTLTVVP